MLKDGKLQEGLKDAVKSFVQQLQVPKLDDDELNDQRRSLLRRTTDPRIELENLMNDLKSCIGNLSSRSRKKLVSVLEKIFCFVEAALKKKFSKEDQVAKKMLLFLSNAMAKLEDPQLALSSLKKSRKLLKSALQRCTELKRKLLLHHKIEFDASDDDDDEHANQQLLNQALEAAIKKRRSTQAFDNHDVNMNLNDSEFESNTSTSNSNDDDGDDIDGRNSFKFSIFRDQQYWRTTKKEVGALTKRKMMEEKRRSQKKSFNEMLKLVDDESTCEKIEQKDVEKSSIEKWHGLLMLHSCYRWRGYRRLKRHHKKIMDNIAAREARRILAKEETTKNKSKIKFFFLLLL